SRLARHKQRRIDSLGKLKTASIGGDVVAVELAELRVNHASVAKSVCSLLRAPRPAPDLRWHEQRNSLRLFRPTFCLHAGSRPYAAQQNHAHSITASARMRNDSEMVNPSVSAALRFTISSNLVGN